MRALAIALVSIALVGCDKGEKGGSKVSGALPATELALFKQLPAGANFVFGGNYMKVQNWMQGAFGDAMAAMGPGWKEWSACWAGLKNTKMAGTATIGSGGGEMRMVFTGATLADMKQCADKAGFKATVDADGKFMLTEMSAMGQTVEQGMLQLADGALYSRQSFGLTPGTVVPGKRPDLEADIAKLAQGTAADDAKLQKLASKVDRTKTMWFAGTAAGTSIGDKLGEVYGSFEIVPGMTMDVTVELLDREVGDKVMEGVAMIKKQVTELPPEMRSVIENLVVKRDGSRFHVKMKISDEQLATFMKQLSAFSGGGL